MNQDTEEIIGGCCGYKWHNQNNLLDVGGMMLRRIIKIALSPFTEATKEDWIRAIIATVLGIIGAIMLGLTIHIFYHVFD